MSQPPRGLGKGLGAILTGAPTAEELRKGGNGEVSAAVRSLAGTAEVPIAEIEPNPYQPRQSFDKEELDGLASSISTLGVITPITIRRIEPHKFQIISGERRFRAAQMAGLRTIPAYIRQADDQGMLEMAIVENVQRSNLDPIEVAQSYRRLMDECSLTQEQMSQRMGLNRSSVANQLRLLNLPPKVQHDLKVGQISVGHAKVLLSVDEPALQTKLCDLCINEGLNVRQLEQKVAAIRSTAADTPRQNAPKTTEDMPQLHKDLCLEVAKYFKGKVSVKRSRSGHGSLTINFSSDKEISSFLDAFKK